MRRRHRGLSLIEILLGLTIGAMMFAAVAMAIQAGAKSTTVNQNFFSATQAGRVGMAYMLRTIRQSDRETVGAATDEEIAELQLTTDAENVAHEFRWDDKTGLLTARRDEPGKTPVQAVLARNVTGFKCRRQTQLAPDGTWVFTNYQINLTITVGQQSISYSESVVPRRAELLR